jgi:D-alanine-D-alanine ligase
MILAGGPDPEHEVSLASAGAVADALRAEGSFEVVYHEFHTTSLEDCRALNADVVWPVLHGRWGEGGPAQDMLEALGAPYVGARPTAARASIDKVLTKTIAAQMGYRISPSAVFNPQDDEPPMAYPFVLKPIYEGSTIGLHICADAHSWRTARDDAHKAARPAMIEPYVAGREITCSLVDTGSGLKTLPLIEITAADGLYDFEAKYVRDDTTYLLDPAIPPKAADLARTMTVEIAAQLGIRHLCRADFMLDDASNLHFLEINTMPGFTTHSLLPLAAAHAGLPMPALCAAIVRAALSPTHHSPA